tara:strand:- start:980 stop:2314 length:1335 start_codon:yes stop_codon:yes gene_type:complete
MVEEYYAKNNLDPKMAFNERAMYKEFAMQAYDDLNLTDFLYGNPFYGKIDREGYAVILDESHLKQYETDTTLFGLNFVVDAFEDFKVKFIYEVTEKLGIANYSTRFMKFLPKRAWISAHQEYHQYQKDIYSIIYQTMFGNKTLRKKYCNFKKFLDFYFTSMAGVARNSPVTKTAFMKSNLSSPGVSGLTIDLFSKIRADDDLKKKDFLEDKFLDFFIRTAIEHGLSLDVNVPWRLVARLDSPHMKKYMRQRNLTIENVFDNAYNRVYKTEYDDFKLTAREYYNGIVTNFSEESFPDYNKKGKMFINTIKREYVSEIDVENMPEMFWLEKYFLIRNIENGKTMSRKEQKETNKKIGNFYRKYGLSKTLDMVEKRLIKLDPTAIPKNRKEKFNYGKLNPSTNIYSGKPEKVMEKKKKDKDTFSTTTDIHTGQITGGSTSGGGSSSY